MLSQEIRSSSIPSREPLSAAIQAALRDERRASVKQDVPCWMASFVVHVSLVLLLAMLIKPGTRDAGWQPTLVASWAAGPEAATPDVGLTPVPPQAPEIVADEGEEKRTDAREPGQQGAEDQGSSGRGSDGPDSAAAEADPNSEQQQQEEQQEQKEEQDDFELFDGLVDEHRSRPAFGEHMMVRRSTSRQSMDDRIKYSAATTLTRHEPHSRGHADAIVRAFIQYDTGRLRGRAGTVAKQQFAQLGPESIPALVRGLNYSANLSASCPVGVISSRLTSLLRQSDDPAALQYAINNLGRGVRGNAPHHRRLTTLRNAILSQASSANSSRGTSAGRGTVPFRRGAQRTRQRPAPRDPWRLAP